MGMSNSDILSVQLFLAACAIAFAGFGMSAARWKHRYFIAGVFTLSAALAIIAISWRGLQGLVPGKASDVISGIATQPIWWLALFIVSFGIVIIISRSIIRLSDPAIARPIDTHLRLQFYGKSTAPIHLDMKIYMEMGCLR
jgi:hypothetical protein